MPPIPTVQTNKAADREAGASRNAERRTELVCRVKYCNTLPDIPFDPKFIQYPFEASRFISYKPTTLERNYKYEFHTEHDLGVTIDLINKDAYNAEPGMQLDPADEKLLEEDVLTPQDSKRSRHHARSVSWLRRTEYISTEQTRFQPQTMDKVEAKVGYSIKKNLTEDPMIMDRMSQITAIQKTFEDAKLPIEKHYSKPNVHPVEVLPLFPDFQCWKYPCAQVIFDSDPAPAGRPMPAQIEEMSQAMIRGVMDESGEQFVAYFLPTEDTLTKRRTDVANRMEYEDDQEYEYKMAREYNWNVKNKASKGYEENYFFIVRSDGIYYNELETRVRLSKRRQKPGQAPSNTKLVVKHRPINELEYRMQRFRERQLEPQGEEEEEEEEPEPEQETITITRTGGQEKENKDSEESDNEEGRQRRKSGSDEGSDNEAKRSRSKSRSKSGSRSRSSSKESKKTKSTRKSRSRSRSGSGSRSGSASRSGSRSKRSGSRSSSRESKKSKSTRKSRSRSRSGSGSRHASGSRSGSGSRKSSRSRSGSGSPSKRSRSGSGSPSKRSRSGSGSPSKRSRSGSGSPSKRSGSGSPSKHSGSGSPGRRSGSGSPGRRSGSGSPSRRSGSGSPARRSGSERSRSGSPQKRSGSETRRSRSGSPASNKSGSGSGSGSGSPSASDSE